MGSRILDRLRSAPVDTMPRKRARRLISEAKQIFVIHSHTDRRRAMALRSRLLRIPRDRDGSSVFVDQVALEPGSSVTERDVLSRLAASDLAIVLCGRDTHEASKVAVEVRQAMRQRTRGSTQVLPIVLAEKITLPKPIDYKVQGIFFNNLFPQLVLIRVATVVGILAAVTVAAVAITSRARASIDAALAQDSLQTSQPTQLGRRLALENLASRARRWFHRDASRRIESRLARIPPLSARRELLPADTTRRLLAWSPGHLHLIVGHADRLAIYEWDSLSDDSEGPVEAHESISISNLRLPPPEQYAYGADSVALRGPGRIIRIEDDPRGSALLFEIEYETAAVPSAFDFAGLDLANQAAFPYVEQHFGPVDVSEREIFRLAFPEFQVTSVGLSRELINVNQHDHEGDEHGYDWYEIHAGSRDLLWRTLLAPSPARLADVDTAIESQGLMGTRWTTRVLATDPVEDAALVLVEYAYDREFVDEYQIIDPPQSGFHLFLSLPDRGAFALTESVSYHPEARYIFWVDQSEPLHTDVIPIYAPAALDVERGWALLRGRLIRFGTFDHDRPFPEDSIRADWDRTERAQSIRSGEAVSLILDDDSIDIVEVGGEHPHRFIPPLGHRAAMLGPDGRTVLVVTDDGRLESWDIEAFGPDGWAGGNPTSR